VIENSVASDTEARVPLGSCTTPSRPRSSCSPWCDVRVDVSAVFQAANVHGGLEHALRDALDSYWERLVVKQLPAGR